MSNPTAVAVPAPEPPKEWRPAVGLRVIRKSQMASRQQRVGVIQHVVKGGKLVNVEYQGRVEYHVRVSELVPHGWEAS